MDRSSFGSSGTYGLASCQSSASFSPPHAFQRVVDNQGSSMLRCSTPAAKHLHPSTSWDEEVSPPLSRARCWTDPLASIPGYFVRQSSTPPTPTGNVSLHVWMCQRGACQCHVKRCCDLTPVKHGWVPPAVQAAGWATGTLGVWQLPGSHGEGKLEHSQGRTGGGECA